MIEINYNREEASLIIESHDDKELTFLHVYYSDGKKKGGFGGKYQLSKIINDVLINFDFPLEMEILAQQGNLIKQFTFKETSINNALTLDVVKEKPLEEIIKWTLEDPSIFQPPINPSLQENRLLKEFIDLIYAYADTEYRELDNKHAYHHFLQSNYSIRLEDSDQSNIILSKCVALLELLTLTQEEMAEFLLNLLHLKK
ncbi:hypothetical protein H9635_04070 [Solibacillus sp. A46]|uniref:Uncharacterized protein n=1 Tax=Solibacillus faecavium TaxID=2762221 RepID=A0ABR8XVD7_9BACL|nr:hypothetical protein [Solibacillus faecavium]MBD8035905.1 hypothetical protein [Solibacillus faecavium]